MENITFIKSDKLKKKPSTTDSLSFGKIFTDYILTMRFDEANGWGGATIEPFSQFTLSPVSAVIHNAQSIYEGMKAFISENGEIIMFNPNENLMRLNRSADRLCMPRIDIDKTLEGIKELLKIEKEWIPGVDGKALYIRITVIGTDENLGEDVSKNYLLYVVLSPADAFYNKQDAAMKIVVEENYSHTFGGIAESKGGASYGETLKSRELAYKKGYDDVLWLDADKKYIETVGQSNVFFVENDEVYTPAVIGKNMQSVMRDNVIEYLTAKATKIKERQIPIKEVIKKLNKGKITEIFVSGAGVVKPVGVVGFGGKNYVVGDGGCGEVTRNIYEYITAVQFGRIQDNFHWTEKI